MLTCESSDMCVYANKKCDSCSRQEGYKHRRSCYSAYVPLCPCGYNDCISDPAFIKCYYPDSYKELYGNKTPEEAVKEHCTEENCYYDSEDK